MNIVKRFGTFALVAVLTASVALAQLVPAQFFKQVVSVPAASIYSTPTLVQHVEWSSNGSTETGNAFKLPLPNATLANDCLIMKIRYPDSVTTVTITDNEGNTWPSTPTATTDDAANTTRFSVFVLPNAAAGVNLITVTFNTAVNGVNPAFQEWYNVATASPVDGSAAANEVVTKTAIASGSFNTSINGDLILHFAQDTGGGPGGFDGSADGISLITNASGYTFAEVDLIQGYFFEYAVQTTAGATNPSSSNTSTTTPTWASITLALKAATAGTAPNPTALRVFGLYHARMGNNGGGSGTGTWPIQFPTKGNLLFLDSTDNSNEITITGVSGSVSGTWTVDSPDAGGPQGAYKTSATAGATEVLSLTLNDTTTHGEVQGIVYDVVNAGAFDKHAFATAGSSFGPGNTPNLPTITPGVSAGIVINAVGLGTGPPNSLTTPSGGQFMSTFYTGMSDLSTMDNGDCHGFTIYSTNAAQNWVYNDTAASAAADGVAWSFQ